MSAYKDTPEDEKCYYAVVQEETSQYPDYINWILDSGATAHMTSLNHLFHQENTPESTRKVITANGHKLRICNQQDVELNMETEAKVEGTTVVLSDVLYVPEITTNIISVPKLSTNGHRVEFFGQECRVIKNNQTICIAKLIRGHFTLKTYNSKTIQKEYTTHDNLCATSVNDKHRVIDNPTNELPTGITEPDDWEDLLKHDNQYRIIWENAMIEEMKTLHEANVWEEIPIPKEARLLPCKWTYKIKVNEHNIPVTAKARLVVKGCSQRPGYDYEDTYAPVVKAQTIRILLTLARHLNWKTKHCDVKAAFLYGHLEETLYMKLPKGPWTNKEKNSCYRLKRAMYGLKQAARAWNTRIHTTLTKLHLNRSEGDRCLYYRVDDDRFIFVVIHVDDLLLFSNSEEYMTTTARHVNNEYTLKDLGEVSLYLGMHISRDTHTGSFKIHQKEKIIKLVSDLNLQESHGKETPMNTEFLRSKPEDTSEYLENNERYQKILGSLMYLSTISRPDISISTNVLGRAVARPTKAHWEGLKRIVRYLKHTIDYELYLDTARNCQLNAFCDADWGGDLHDRKSTSGGAIFLGTSLIGWYSRKQKSVTLSSAEAELMALSTMIQELTWINRVVQDIQIESTSPITIKTDSQSAMNMVSNEGSSSRSKHIDIRRHYIKDKLDENFAQLEHCGTEIMTADTFTKPLDKVKFCRHRDQLQLYNSDSR